MYGINEMLMVLWWLWHMPLMSETEITLASRFKRSATQTVLKHCSARGWVGALKDGRTRSIKARYFLLHSGIQEVRRQLDLALQWQVTERGILEIWECLEALEVTYEVMTRLFQSSVVSLPWVLPLDPSDDPVLLRLDRHTRLSGFRWIKARRKGFAPLAVAEYTTRDAHQLWIPVYWFGKNFKRPRSPMNMNSFRQTLATAASPWDPNAPASPIGSVVIAADHFSAWRARTEVVPNHRVAMITASGDLVC